MSRATRSLRSKRVKRRSPHLLLRPHASSHRNHAALASPPPTSTVTLASPGNSMAPATQPPQPAAPAVPHRLPPPTVPRHRLSSYKPRQPGGRPLLRPPSPLGGRRQTTSTACRCRRFRGRSLRWSAGNSGCIRCTGGRVRASWSYGTAFSRCEESPTVVSAADPWSAGTCGRFRRNTV